MEPLVFEEIEIGDDLPDAKPDVSMDCVKAFTSAAYGRVLSRFNDNEKAKGEGLPGAIVPGVMSQALLVAMIHRWAPGCDIEKIDTVFRAHVLVDSTPVCRAVVTDIDAEARTVEVDLTIVNEAGETRVMGTARVRL